MRRVLFWAAGANARKFAGCLKEDVEICAFVDNDALRWGEQFCGSVIIPASDIHKCQYDYLVITTPEYKDILDQLRETGIERKKIITPFAPDRDERTGWREVFHVGELLYYVSELRLSNLSYTLENAPYEISAGIENGHLRKPIIQSVDETLKKLQEGYSMSRYGDGELNMILGRNFSTFQCPDTELITRLKEILRSSLPKHLVCLPDIYGDFYNRNPAFKGWFRRHLAEGGREYDYGLFDMDKAYYNAFITRPYIDYADSCEACDKFRRLRELWQDRDITIIEGEKTRFGVGNNLISNASSCERILGPAVNAFEKYKELLAQAVQTDKNRLILIALGQTATVLAYDLARQGFQAWDIGHLDIEYEWFLRGIDKKIPIEGKYVNEAPMGRYVPEQISDETYNSEIITRIF